ncbi:MAG: nucleotide sugar dehydrogenase [Nitrospiraceae bacterium]|nr:nucleotide sugar dehydrogenase [Nitrospiraceae bacterium]
MSFIPTCDYSVIKKVNHVIITVGTPLRDDESKRPDYPQINDVIDNIVPFFHRGLNVILRSTVTPGTTELVFNLIKKKTGLNNDDFYVSFCPERIAEGYPIKEIRELPQIIGGVNSKSNAVAKELFSKINGDTITTTPRAAELSKLFTNAYRYVNFAIANQFDIIANEYGEDGYKIIEMSNYNYKRGGIPKPGFAAGPCLYKDTLYLNSDGKYPFLEHAVNVNYNYPDYLVTSLEKVCDVNGKTVVILGMSFKGDVDDIRSSLSIKLRDILMMKGAIVKVYDPLIKSYSIESFENIGKNANILFVAVPHSAFNGLSLEWIEKNTTINTIVDPWRFFKSKLIFRLK